MLATLALTRNKVNGGNHDKSKLHPRIVSKVFRDQGCLRNPVTFASESHTGGRLNCTGILPET
jgi:hypothetical protein